MKIVIAPDSYKGSLRAARAAAAIESGVRRVWPKARCTCIPMADGGEGTVDAILAARGGNRRRVRVTGPGGGEITASYALLEGATRAVIEMAAASGLTLLREADRNPLLTTSYGTGQLIAHAMEQGATEILVGVGGSATVDGGAGMAQALGVRFRNARGRGIRRHACGGMLDRIADYDRDRVHPLLSRTRIRVAADVTNVLCGRAGAARVYGPQKGADPAAVARLDRNLRHLAAVMRSVSGRDVARIPGAGAAGGLAAGLAAFADASIERGFSVVARETGLERQIRSADLVITGEGCIDAQTLHGKVPAGVIGMARSAGVPVIAIGGMLGDGAGDLYDLGVTALVSSAIRDMPVALAMRHAGALLADAAERAMRLVRLGTRLEA